MLLFEPRHHHPKLANFLALHRACPLLCLPVASKYRGEREWAQGPVRWKAGASGRRGETLGVRQVAADLAEWMP